MLLSSSTYEIKPRRRRRAQARRRDGASEREPDDDDDEPESAIDRLRRLRSEVAELEEQVTRERAEQEREGTSATEVGPAAAAGEDAGKDETGDKGSKRRKKKQVSPDVILRHLQLLQTDLSRLRPVEYDDSHEFTGSSGAGAGSGELRTRAEASSSKLARLGLVRDGENVAVGDESQAPRPHQPARAMDQGELEHRLASLEKFIGASEAEVDEVSLASWRSVYSLADDGSCHCLQRNAMPAPLVQSVARLEHLLTLLTQPRHLDGVSRRVKVLVTDLERLHETRRKLGDTRPLNVALSAGSLTVATAGGAAGPATATGGGAGEGGGGGVTPELAQKIDTLFSLVPRVDALVPVVPRVLMRLRALARVHDDAAVFRDALREAEAGCARLKRDEGDLRAVLDGVRARMDDNEGTLRGNLGELEGRINDVVARLDKLQSSAS